MEEEQRKKKLEAGKEKLAAFRKKKAKKRRKPTDDDASSQRSGSMADASSCSDVQSLTGDSDQSSVVSYSGEEWSAEEADLHSSVYYQTKLVDATRRVAELEEMIEGKQLALDKVLQENDLLRQQPKQQQETETVDSENNIAEGSVGVAETRIHSGDLHSALAQRDLIIQQLTSRLKATAEKSAQDYTQETQTLAHQVSLLQQQLQQAGETLRGQLTQHNVSAQALQEAKAEILALQTLLQEKEHILAQLSQDLLNQKENPQRLELREKEVESSVHGYEAKTKELEASVSQYEIKIKELVERYELREKELVLCVQQHEVREKELEVFVQQYASKEATLQETISRLETQLEAAVSDKQAVIASLESVDQSEQQKIAVLTLQLQNLNQEKDEVVSELDQMKTRNVELEELCKQLEDLQEECLLKQSENDELRNRINDQQGETLALKSQVEVLLQEGEQSSQELDVLRDLLENKEQDQEIELQRKNTFILQLETDIKKLQGENSTYVSDIESLNSQILSLQADLSASVTESQSYRTLADKFKSELIKAGKDPESVSGDHVDGHRDDDDVDGSDVFAVESELEVRRISANDQTNVELKGFITDSVTLSESEVRKNFQLEVSHRVLDEEVVRTENIKSLGLASSSTEDEGSVTRPPETDSKNMTLNKKIATLEEVCKEQENKLRHLQNDNDALKSEISDFKTQLASSETNIGDIEHQNCILVNQQEESYIQLQSLSSELHITCDKLKESKHKCEHVSKQLSYRLEENASLVAKLSQSGEEVKLIQSKLDESQQKLKALEVESEKIKEELEGKCLEYENQLSEIRETQVISESALPREDDAEIRRLQKELVEAKAGLEEVSLGAEMSSEALQNQCDRYAAEAAKLQAELSQANEELSQANEELSQAKKDCSQCQERIVACEHELKELAAERESLLVKEQEQSQILKSERGRHNDEVCSLKQKLDQTGTELQQEKENSISLQCEVSNLKKGMEDEAEVMARSKQEVLSLREQYDSLSEVNRKESETQRDILCEEVASTTQQLHSASSEIVKMNLKMQQNDELTKQRLQELEDKCRSSEEMINTLQTENERLHEFEKQVVELKKKQELMETDLERKELLISNLRGEVEQRDEELCSVKEVAESRVREHELQISQLQEQLQKHQVELDESALKLASAQNTSANVSSELNDTKALLLTRQSELDETVAKLQELTFGAEQSQAELQMKCADQASEISKLGLEKERFMEELEKVVAEAETTRTALMTDVEKFKMEAGSLQNELEQIKLEHGSRLTEEQNVRSEFKSRLDAASAERSQLQTALDNANKELEETKCEMQKLSCDFQMQLEQYARHVEDLKNENRASKTEFERLQTKSQCEEDNKIELQNLVEHSVAEINNLKDDMKLSKEELEDVQAKNQSLEETLFIEQAARVELQSQYDSISSEFDRVNTNEKKLKKDFVSYVQRIGLLITLTNLKTGGLQHVDVSSIGTGLGVLEESLNRMKLYIEEQTAIQEDLTEKVTCLEASNTELNQRISSLSSSEESLKSVVEDLKDQLEKAESQGASALAEVKSCQHKVESLQEEKEILKANFDSCMEDMQQKLSEQEMRTRKLQGEMIETAKNKDRDSNETKIMYEAHISQMEEKQLAVETELARAKKIISESTETNSTVQDTYENKVSEMEENINRLEFEKTKLKDQLSKSNENFQQEKEEIKVIFESQITELEENSKALESAMFRLKDQLSDAGKAHEQEKEDMEKTFDMQLSEWEDRCRIFEMENGKLKRQMDEMDKDFKSEKEEIERMYERQLIELEDRCSQSELTANTSKRNMADISVDFDDVKLTYQIKVQELEERCEELEKSRLDVQERLELVSESAQQERKSLQESMSAQITDIQKHYTVLETEYSALKEVFEQTQACHQEEVDQLKLDYQRKMEVLEEKVEQFSVQVVQENLQVETASLEKKEIQSLRTDTEAYKFEIDRLTKEKEDVQTELENESEHLKEVTQKLNDLETIHQNEIDNYRIQIESMASGEESEVVKETIDRMRSEIDKLTLEITSSKQDLKKEKQKLKAAKLASEKSKKEAQLIKTSSEQEIQSLKQRLEAWEVELIQRRKFVEQDQTVVDSDGVVADSGSKRQAELEILVKNYERKVDDLTRKLEQHHSDQRQMNFVSVGRNGSSEPPEGFDGIEEPPFTDAFEPEPLTPDVLQSQPNFHSDGGHISKETVVPIMQGFQPEVEGHDEGFVPEAVHPLSHNLTLNMTKEEKANVQTESHSAQPNDSLTSGDGFLPEVDDSKTDTFQPEAAGEFKPDHIHSQSHMTLSTIPQPTPLTAGTQSPHTTYTQLSTVTTGTQTEVFDAQSPNTVDPETQGPTLTSANDSSSSEDLQLLKRQHDHEKGLIEEQYMRKMKNLEVELQHKHQTAMEEYQKSVDQKMQQDLSIRTRKKHQEFIKELKKARKTLEAKHKAEVEKVKQEMSSRLEAAVVEQSESELLKQLHKENQDLAEARDALLQEISQNQQIQEEQESLESKPEHKTSSPKADHSTDDSQRDSSDRHQSDKFLEELESLSLKSGSELPLEWEIAMSSDDGLFDRELDGDGNCARHECLEMKQKYQRLFELYQRAQGDTDSVFIVEQSPERNPSSNFGRRSRVNSSEQGSETTGSSCPRHEGVDTSQEVSEGDFEDSFKDRIQKLEAENIALEKKLCDQLEKFSVEKHQLEKRCEHLQVNLNNTAFSRQEVENKLVQQNEILQSSLSQLRTEFKSSVDEEIVEDVVDQSFCALGTASVQTQTEVSGDALVMIMNEHTEAHQRSFIGGNDSADEILEETLSAKKEDESGDPHARMSTPKSEKKNVRTELSFTESEAGVSEQSQITSVSSPEDSFLLPSVDHMERMIFTDSRKSLSPTGRMKKKKKESPIEISFNTTSVVSMKSTEGGVSVNQEQIEITGTVNSAGTIVPEDYAKVALEIHHTELVEEISRLRRDLHETKSTYARELALLQEQLEREKVARLLWLEKKVPDDQLIKELPLQTDVIELRKEVALLTENNKMIMNDNKHLMEQVREKECALSHFRDKYDLQSVELEEFSHGSDTQLLLIQKQRDELLEELKDFHSEHERLLSVLDARTVMEETLRREKEMLLEKLVQHEDVQNISTQKHSELEFVRGEQRRLEQLLLLKDENEQQLQKQKRVLEEELFDIEGRLREREAFLEEEKFRLLREVKEKNLTILKLETMTGGSKEGPSRESARRASTGHVPSSTRPGVREGPTAVDTPYDEAIEILREKLKLEYEVKEAVMQEQHAGQTAAFWKQQNKKVP